MPDSHLWEPDVAQEFSIARFGEQMIEPHNILRCTPRLCGRRGSCRAVRKLSTLSTRTEIYNRPARGLILI
jgi:hypothetical protein